MQRLPAELPQVRHVLKQESQSVFSDGEHLGPDAEINFWKNLAANLNSIYAQLQMEGVKKGFKFLEANRSTYIASFCRLQKEADAREEVNSNAQYLAPLEVRLKPLINAAETSRDLTTLHELFDPIFELMANEEYIPLTLT